MCSSISKGTWVQIENVILSPEERTGHIPEDTRQEPLRMRVKGYLSCDAEVGDEVTVTTIIGRKLTGRLVAENPPYIHNFGRPIPELLSVGSELRELIRRGRNDD